MDDINTMKAAPADTELHELIRKRWSPRAFSDLAVSDAELKRIFWAASWASSSSNEQPWRFLLGRKGDRTHERIFDALVDFNKLWAGSAPVLIVSAAKRTTTKDGSENAYALHDTGAASANMTVEATALGLYMHGMAGFDKDKLRRSFNIPVDFELVAVWALGHLGSIDTLPEFLKTLETAPRQRRSLAETVYREWESSAF